MKINGEIGVKSPSGIRAKIPLQTMVKIKEAVACGNPMLDQAPERSCGSWSVSSLHWIRLSSRTFGSFERPSLDWTSWAGPTLGHYVQKSFLCGKHYAGAQEECGQE